MAVLVSTALVLIAGAETWRSRTRLRAAGRRLEGTAQDESVPVAQGSDDEFQMSGEAQIRVKLDRPAYVYPMFEQAVRIVRGETPDAHRRRWDVVDNLGHRFIAEIKHLIGGSR
jgi:acetyl-CoA C-acetyltransferase